MAGSGAGKVDLYANNGVSRIKPDDTTTGTEVFTLPKVGGTLARTEDLTNLMTAADVSAAIAAANVGGGGAATGGGFDGVISKPSILSPLNNASNYNGKNVKLSSFAYDTAPTNDPIVKQRLVQIASDAGFTTIIYAKTVDGNENNFDVPVTYMQSVLYMRVADVVTGGVSPFSDVVSFASTSDDTLPGAGVPIKHHKNSFYFGVVTGAALESDRNYCGNFVPGIAVNAGDTYSSADGTVLRRATINSVDVSPEHADHASYWETRSEKNENALPTYDWLVKNVRIGAGVTDSNSKDITIGSTSIGAVKNLADGYLKFLHKGKLLYIAKKPCVDTIAYNDLAKLHICNDDHQNRTIRIGYKLYYVRLVREDEYADLLVGLTNGELGNNDKADYALDEATWISDTSLGDTRTVISGDYSTAQVDARSRTCSYRPVLEYIPEGEEPYNIFQASTRALNENLQYDRFTDTGFYGVVDQEFFLDYAYVSEKSTINTGTDINYMGNWLKFYWHGQILLIAKLPARNASKYQNIINAAAIYGVDLGNKSMVPISENNDLYAACVMSGASTDPAGEFDAFYGAGPSNPSNETENEAKHDARAAFEVGRNSHWNDLMYRVHSWSPNSSYADLKANATYIDGPNDGGPGGRQIGSNWANFTDAELGIGMLANGTANSEGQITQCQDSAVGDTIMMTRGRGNLASCWYGYHNMSDTKVGYRPVLKLIPVVPNSNKRQG